MAVNVNRENPDQFYRYKMPLLQAKVEGKGNGIKTVIVNMVDVGKALGRPPSYPCKYFGCELGAQTQMDHKIGRYIVNGAHESAKLQDMLDGFIKKFVLCTECENPETELSVQVNKGRITQSCKACGYHTMVDPRHKLTTFIIKNPPNGMDESSAKKDKKARRAEKLKGKGKKDDEPPKPARQNSPTYNDQNGEEEIVPPPPLREENGDEDWSADTSEAAVKARSENLSEHISALALTNDAEMTSSQRLDKFFKFVDEMKKSGGVTAISASLSKIKAEAERLEVIDKAPGILAEVLYTKNLLAEVKEYRLIMLHFTVSNRKAQRYLLIGFEKLVETYQDQLLPKAALIIKSFYDNDILEEEAILEWADKASKKHVDENVARQIHERVAPVINWLRTAEEESDEEEEEEDDEVEVVYTEKASKTGIVTEAVPPPEEVVGDDFDIDAI